jgi:hypothetical protein
MLQVNSTSDIIDPNSIESIYADACVVAEKGGAPSDGVINHRMDYPRWLMVYQMSKSRSAIEASATIGIETLAAQSGFARELEAYEVARSESDLERDLEEHLLPRGMDANKWGDIIHFHHQYPKLTSLFVRRTEEYTGWDSSRWLDEFRRPYICPPQIRLAFLRKAAQTARTAREHTNVATAYSMSPVCNKAGLERAESLRAALKLSPSFKERLSICERVDWESALAFEAINSLTPFATSDHLNEILRELDQNHFIDDDLEAVLLEMVHDIRPSRATLLRMFATAVRGSVRRFALEELRSLLKSEPLTN